MTQTNLINRLDDFNGPIKNEQNSKMQTSDQPPKTPWFLRMPKAILRKNGLLAVFAVGVDVASSLLKSKKAAAAVIVGLLSEPPKKFRLACAFLFSLLTAFFIANPKGSAAIDVPFIPAPVHERITGAAWVDRFETFLHTVQ